MYFIIMVEIISCNYEAIQMRIKSNKVLIFMCFVSKTFIKLKPVVFFLKS